MMLERSSFYYRSHPRDHRGLSMRIKELAMTRIRFGYLRLTVLLKRGRLAGGEETRLPTLP
jgi:putative transposase